MVSVINRQEEVVVYGGGSARATIGMISADVRESL